MNQAADRHAMAVLAACLLWGTTGTVAHQAPSGSSALVIGLCTFGVGGLILLALDARAVMSVLQNPGNRMAVIVGAVGVVTYATCFYQAMALAGVAVGNVIALGAGPILAAVVEFVLDRSVVTRRWLGASALAITGMALLALGGSEPVGGALVPGVCLALAAALGYALYSCMGARVIRRGAGSRPTMAAIFAIAALAEIPMAVAHGLGPLTTAPGLLILGYLALGPMALAYLLFGYGLRQLSASTATTIALAEPVVATVLAVVVVGERPSAIAWWGIAQILSAVVILAVPGDSRGRNRG